MKKNFNLLLKFLVLTIIIMSCETQPPLAENPTPEFQKIFEINDTDMVTLFVKSQMWASDRFVSAKDAIEITNKESGLITIRTADQKGSCTIYFKVILEIKDNKVRITCKNPTYEVNYVYIGIQSAMRIDQSMVDAYTIRARSIIIAYGEYINEVSSDW